MSCVRRGALGGAALLIFGLGACSTTQDLVELVPETEVRVGGAPLGPVRVRLRADKRPFEEHGTREYLGSSHLSASALSEPTDVSLLRVLVRDLVRSGVASRAGLIERTQPFILEVEVLHLTGAFGEGLENLTLVLPTSAVRGWCQLHLRLVDPDGRVFLEEDFEGIADRNTSLLGGLESAAANALAAAMRAAIDRALPSLHAAVPAFWQRYGREPPAH